MPATVRISFLVSVLAVGTAAQSTSDDLTITTSSGTFRLPALTSLVDEPAVLSAERVAELALPAAQHDVTAARDDVDRIDDAIATNFKAMAKAKETVAPALGALQPAIDAYKKDLEALQADDVQFARDKAPLQAEIDRYAATAEKDRTEAEYKRLATLKAPFDARWEAILARKAALKTRYDAMAKEWSDVEAPLAKLQEVDLELLAQRKVTMAALGDAYRQLQACYLYATQIKAQLERMNRTSPSTLTPLLETASVLLKRMSSLVLDGAKQN